MDDLDDFHGDRNQVCVLTTAAENADAREREEREWREANSWAAEEKEYLRDVLK